MTVQSSTAEIKGQAENQPIGESQKFVTFLVGDRSYGVNIIQVREIKQWSQITALPNQKDYTIGVLNLRGTVVPVHDLRVRFGGPPTEPTKTHVVVIVLIFDQIVGILVDAVSDIINIQLDDVQALPASLAATNDNSICSFVSVESDMVALLNLEALFAQVPSAISTSD